MVGAEVGKVDQISAHPRITTREYRVDLILVGALATTGTSEERFVLEIKGHKQGQMESRVRFATARSSEKTGHLIKGSFFGMATNSETSWFCFWEKKYEMRGQIFVCAYRCARMAKKDTIPWTLMYYSYSYYYYKQHLQMWRHSSLLIESRDKWYVGHSIDLN